MGKLNLTARSVASIDTPGRHGDGDGLYLQVAKGGSKSWIFRWRDRTTGKLREKGLGSLSVLTLAEARSAAGAARTVVHAGGDPIAEKTVAAKILAPTFGEVADEFIASMESGFRNAKHRAQWRMTLTDYCRPIRNKPVAEIDTADMLKVLKPIWITKPETAARLRGRIERVLSAAKAKGLRSGENPAMWRDHLVALLPKPKKLSRGHHAALDVDAMPDFMTKLRQREGTAARALELAILTAARSGEVRLAEWDEFDLEKAVWTVPAERMKAKRPHRVPLVPRAVELLSSLVPETERAGLVFHGAKRGRPMSDMTLAAVLKRMKLDVTVHGFRSTFRDWAGDHTHFPREMAEAALAHTVGDSTERAYRRSDALERRRELMNAWAAWCEPKADNVVTLKGRG